MFGASGDEVKGGPANAIFFEYGGVIQLIFYIYRQRPYDGDHSALAHSPRALKTTSETYP
ncbi:hypothetical protein [Paraburkholderia sp. J41]|uniref:hypothetical protein n=1 Tax=Paraburkholderia sp. J41 TaxID=2805433 RepID=UPI002AC32E6A|nr:hypothetical protein [Paraburkholderia sp. J41]